MKKLNRILIIVLLCFALLIPASASSVQEQIEDCKTNMDLAHQIAELARELGYEEDHEIITHASRRWWSEYELLVDLQAKLDKHDEYQVAWQVWDSLHDFGLSDALASGIIGNMMAECGGQTLDLQPYVYGGGGSYYGLCQWSRLYYPQAMGLGVEEQMQVLMDTIENTMRERGGSYAYFLTIDNAYDAAYYFEKYYEGAGWASIRGQNALDAFEYFTI